MSICHYHQCSPIGNSIHLSYLEYCVNFYGNEIKTTVTDVPRVVDAWISTVQNLNRESLELHRLVVGLDIEWHPNYNRYQNRNKVATLQLCVGRRCLIFQIFHAIFIPQSLRDFLGNRDHTFVGVGIGADNQKLFEDYGLWVGRSVDLTIYSVRRNIGLKDLAREILRFDIEKPSNVTLSNWQAEYLTPPQVEYACIDAFVSFRIGMVCEAWIRGIIK